MEYIIAQLGERAKIIWIIILALVFTFFILDPTVKWIEKWWEKRKNKK